MSEYGAPRSIRGCDLLFEHLRHCGTFRRTKCCAPRYAELGAGIADSGPKNGIQNLHIPLAIVTLSRSSIYPLCCLPLHRASVMDPLRLLFCFSVAGVIYSDGLDRAKPCDHVAVRRRKAAPWRGTAAPHRGVVLRCCIAVRCRGGMPLRRAMSPTCGTVSRLRRTFNPISRDPI
jgi:hypothetical protein